MPDWFCLVEFMKTEKPISCSILYPGNVCETVEPMTFLERKSAVKLIMFSCLESIQVAAWVDPSIRFVCFEIYQLWFDKLKFV